MKLDLITNKAERQGEVNPNDEFYTPNYAIEPLLKYLKPSSFIWCPFDTHESNFVKMLINAGHNVHWTHIEAGMDFFTEEPPKGIDYIISNPPYSIKHEVFERLFKLNIPFAFANETIFTATLKCPSGTPSTGNIINMKVLDSLNIQKGFFRNTKKTNCSYYYSR